MLLIFYNFLNIFSKDLLFCFKVANLIMWNGLDSDPDPKGGKFLDPDPNVLYLDQQHRMGIVISVKDQ